MDVQTYDFSGKQEDFSGKKSSEKVKITRDIISLNIPILRHFDQPKKQTFVSSGYGSAYGWRNKMPVVPQEKLPAEIKLTLPSATEDAPPKLVLRKAKSCTKNCDAAVITSEAAKKIKSLLPTIKMYNQELLPIVSPGHIYAINYNEAPGRGSGCSVCVVERNYPSINVFGQYGYTEYFNTEDSAYEMFENQKLTERTPYYLDEYDNIGNPKINKLSAKDMVFGYCKNSKESIMHIGCKKCKRRFYANERALEVNPEVLSCAGMHQLSGEFYSMQEIRACIEILTMLPACTGVTMSLQRAQAAFVHPDRFALFIKGETPDNLHLSKAYRGTFRITFVDPADISDRDSAFKAVYMALIQAEAENVLTAFVLKHIKAYPEVKKHSLIEKCRYIYKKIRDSMDAAIVIDADGKETRGLTFNNMDYFANGPFFKLFK